MRSIVTMYSGEKGDKLRAITEKRHLIYANKCSAVLRIIGGRISTSLSVLMMQKMEYVSSLLQKGERVLWIDGDILIHRDSPNLFDVVPTGRFAAFNEGSLCNDHQIYERCSHIVQTCHEEGLPIPEIHRRYFNMGMFMAERHHAGLFAPRKTYSNHNWCEQSLINIRMIQDGVMPVSLPECFNRFVYWGPKPDKYEQSSYFLHYAGPASPEVREHDMKVRSEKWGDL